MDSQTFFGTRFVTSYAAPRPANENADPSATVASSLDWLYLLRRELLKQDVSAMTLDQRRLREDALRKFARAEALLLAEM